MEFLKRLKNDKFSEDLKSDNITIETYKNVYGDSFLLELPRRYNHIIFNNDIRLSIQASAQHYCEPRITQDDVSHYKTMEVAIMQGGVFIGVEEILPELEKEFEKVFRWFRNPSIWFCPT